MDVVTKYYTELYGEKACENGDEFMNVIDSFVPKSEWPVLLGEISESEVREVAYKAAKNKAPGVDGGYLVNSIPHFET